MSVYEQPGMENVHRLQRRSKWALRVAIAGAGATEIRFPDDHPIAEVYPLSTDNWAPPIITWTVADPLPSLHGGTVTDATAAVTWTAMPGLDLKAGQSVDLTMSVGPLPATPQLGVGVIVTRSDGVVERWTPPARRPARSTSVRPWSSRWRRARVAPPPGTTTAPPLVSRPVLPRPPSRREPRRTSSGCWSYLCSWAA